MAVDDVSGKEKKVTNQMLITANELQQACERLIESLGNLLVTYKIAKIQESPIVEIFPYIEDDREEEPQAVAVPETTQEENELSEQEAETV
jgi:tRNA (Thr-GGU) A37 N-methylase